MSYGFRESMIEVDAGEGGRKGRGIVGGLMAVFLAIVFLFLVGRCVSSFWIDTEGKSGSGARWDPPPTSWEWDPHSTTRL